MTLGYGVITELLPDVDMEAYMLDRKKERRARKQAADKESAWAKSFIAVYRI